jgi:hypothetical protein
MKDVVPWEDARAAKGSALGAGKESETVLLSGANPLTLLGRYMRGFAAKLWISFDEAKLLKLPARTTARAPA